MNRDGLTADQDENSSQQCKHARQNADAQPGEGDDPNRNQINREKKQSDVFRYHVASIANCAFAWQSWTRSVLRLLAAMMAATLNTIEALLSAGDANYHRGNIFHINEGAEVFRAYQIRKMDNTISHLGNFASHFLSRC